MGEVEQVEVGRPGDAACTSGYSGSDLVELCSQVREKRVGKVEHFSRSGGGGLGLPPAP